MKDQQLLKKRQLCKAVRSVKSWQIIKQKYVHIHAYLQRKSTHKDKGGGGKKGERKKGEDRQQ